MLIDLIIGLLFFALAFIALVDGGYKRLQNRIFALLSFFLIAWLITNQISSSIETPEAVAIAANYILFASSFAATLLITKLLVGLVNSSPIQKLFKVLEPILWLIVILSATPLVGRGVELQGQVYGVVFGPAVGAYAGGLVALLILSTITLIIGWNSRDVRQRNQVRVIGLSLLVTGPIVLLLGFLIPYFTNNFAISQISIAPLIILAIGIFRSIVRHGLFDIRLAVMRTTAYAMSIVTLAGVYFGLAYLASVTVFRDQVTTGLSMSPVNIGLALVLALVFQPIKQFFDKLTNQIFYRDSYDTNEFITRLGRILTGTTHLEELLELALNEIVTTLKISGGLFIVYRDHHDDMLVGKREHDSFNEVEYDVLRRLADLNGPGVLVVSKMTNQKDGELDRLHRILERKRVLLVLPLVSANETIGYLLLGEQMSTKYAKRDIRVLETIANELVIAIMNARSVQVVRDLNAHLEERVSHATRELRRSNKRLLELDETKDEFLSMASHQLRTPLTSIKGYISMVLEGDVGDVSPAQKRLLEEAFTSSERMVHLIGDFLNVSRLQTGKFIIDPHASNLAKVAKQEIDSIKQIATAHEIKINYKEPPRFPELYLDEGKIRQVIMNFIDNAIYYSPEGKTIKVALAVEDGNVVLRVIDNGMGVPAAVQKKLFTKFFRAENARKQRPDGTGIGLYLAKKVIDGHGGSLVFESVEGKGSTFGFRLPIKKLSTPPKPKVIEG